MKNKKTRTLIAFGVLAGTMLTFNAPSLAKAESNDLTIFENGAFCKEVIKHSAGSAIDDGKWHNDGSWSASRVYLNEGIDLSKYETITLTYMNSGTATWVEFGVGNSKDQNEFDYVTKGVTFINDGEEHNITYNIDDFASATTVNCTWGGTHDKSLDMTSIIGFCIKAGNVTVNVSKITATPKQAAANDLNLFKDGTWVETPTIDDAVKTNSFIEDNMWKIRGNGSTLCRIKFSNSINLKNYKRLIIEYKNSNAESIQFGIGTIDSSWAYTSVHKNVSLVKDSTDTKTFSVNLVDYDNVAFDRILWGDVSGNLDLANIKGFDFVGDQQNIDIVSIVATATGEEDPFDPTPVDVSLFDNTTVNEKAEFHNANAYKIKYGTNSYAYVGSSNASSLSADTAQRIADGENYAIKYTNANMIRYDNSSSFDLIDAMLNDGWLEFDLNFDTLPTSNKFNFRLYDGSAPYGERYCIETSINVNGTQGSYSTYRINIKDLNKYCYTSSWGSLDSTKIKLIDISTIQGFGFTFDQDVSVSIRNLHYGYTPVNHKITGIESLTTKTNYNSGDLIDLTTFKTNVLFDDNTKIENISNFTVKNIGAVTLDNKLVDVSFKYKGEKYDTTVDLSVNSATKLEIKTMPTKLIYNEGETLDLTGIVVEATMSDNSTKTVDISELQSSVDIVSTETTEVKLSYAGASTTFNITVNMVGKTYSSFGSDYLTYDETTNKVNIKDGYFVGGNDNNSETPTAYVDKVDDGKLAFVTNQTVDWRISRFLSSDGYLDLQEINLDTEIEILITYRTSNVTNGNFYLFNPIEESDWDQVYSNTTLSFKNDGNWHTTKLSLDALLVEAAGHLDTGDIPTGYSMISPKKISGWGLGLTGKVEISQITYHWNNEMDAKWHDTKAPKITYDGEVTFNQIEGEKPIAVNATAYDSYDGEITPTYTWSAGALDENGNLKVGTHTLTISAKDNAGNEAAVRTITYIVSPKQTPDPIDPITPDEPTNDGLSTGAIVGIVAGSVAVAGAAVGTYFFLKKKKNK